MPARLLLNHVVSLCRTAGSAILEVYNAADGFAVDYKADDSPVTAADMAAHHILVEGLEALARLPVLSEESVVRPFAERRLWQRYWLVDPLDGTREFVSRTGEFTVNVALIDRGLPVLGVVHAPVLDITYTGLRGQGAHKIENDQSRSIKVRSLTQHLGAGKVPEILRSRRHGTDAATSLARRLEDHFGAMATATLGSSLKHCLVAEGRADLYPRLGPTSEWDTGAAQAVVEAAGGQVLDQNLDPMRYNQQEQLIIPAFFVIGDKTYPWRRLLSLD